MVPPICLAIVVSGFFSSQCLSSNHTILAFHFQHDLIVVQEEQIHKFKDTLITGVGEDRLGSSSELVALCAEAMQRKKTSCQTQLHRYLAFANPANGEDFFREVKSSSRVFSVLVSMYEIFLKSYSFQLFLLR